MIYEESKGEAEMGQGKWNQTDKSIFLYGFVGFEGSCVLHSPNTESGPVKNFMRLGEREVA